MDNMEGNQPPSSQEDDMIPLSKLRNRISTDAGSSDEDIPLADLRRAGSPILDFDDSYADPEYKLDLRRAGSPIPDFDDSDADPEYKPDEQSSFRMSKHSLQQVPATIYVQPDVCYRI
ncbi:hypothetical protein PoB_003861900 [Plakobranchus ocellatus]|uniref:Uncharacterized protein n=1 Tax=Plakobranchus ocellatus TaxID=259542 RepID=A0AAV4B0C2_9GAST|nr:hypothetical protein PoB_003861900 [Plakobranchus ocellatus]